MPSELVVAIARNIARVVGVPVSIDIEGGYSSDPAEVAQLVVTLAEAGVAGINLEDGSEPAELLARTRLPLNVMAWQGLASPDRLHRAGVRRLSAGAGISARVWAQSEALARHFLETGELAGAGIPFNRLQKLFP